MKTPAPRPTRTPQAAAPAHAAAQPDRRPEARAQHQLQAAIDGSPHQLAQAMPAQVPAPNHTGLPDQLKSGVESLAGHSLDDVKVHYNSAKPAELHAHAYAQGTDIHLAPGQEQHLPHEAWHVVQQKQGRVQPTRQLKGKALNDSFGLEQEADRMGRKAAGVKPGSMPPAAALPAAPVQRQVIQRTVWEWDGEAWVSKDGSSRDTDEHEHPADQDFEDLEPGDQYDQNEGTLHRRARHSRERMERAEERQSTRTTPAKRGQESATDYSAISKKRGNRVVDATPFGSMRFGRGMYNTQPYGSLDPSDWPAAPEPVRKGQGKGRAKGRARKKAARPKSIPTNYDVVSQTLEASGHEEEVLQEIGEHLATTDAPQPSALSLSRPQQQAATALSSLLAVAEPHGQRNPVGGKVERAAIRYAREEGIRKTFNRRDGAYVPAHATAGGAKKGGTGAFREMRRGSRPLPLPTLDLLDHLSDSSADEAEPVEKKPARRKAVKKTPKAKRDRVESSSEEETRSRRKRRKKKKDEDEDQ